MSVDIRTTSIEPLRHTFSNVAARLGADKPASRYQEATFDLQPTTNFHYRPTWDPDHLVYDTGRTALVMDDWYSFKDPRQLYYGAWTTTRAKQQELADKNFSFVEKRNLLDRVSAEGKSRAAAVLVPLRHLEYAANLNNCFMSAYGYGTAITQACSFNAIDRLGMGQYLTRLGLQLGANDPAILDQAKVDWMEKDAFQPLRRLAEKTLVVRDWFELFVAQNLVLDGLMFPMIYTRFDEELIPEAGSTFSMLTQFQTEWFVESSRWADATIKTAVQESDANRQLIEQWIADWRERVNGALLPLANEAFGGAHGQAVLDELNTELDQRLAKKAGLN